VKCFCTVSITILVFALYLSVFMHVDWNWCCV